MMVLDDNNSYVEPTHLMVTLVVVTTWCSQIDACRWCSWSLGDMLMSWWWSFDGLIDGDDGDGASVDDATWRCPIDALCLHSLYWCMQLDPMPYDTLEPWVSLMMDLVAWWVSTMLRMTWFVDGDDMMMSCLDSLMEMTWWCIAMIDMLMTYLVGGDDVIHSCVWWDVDELMSLVMRYPIPFHSPTLALALPILAIPCKTLIHPS